MTLKRCKLIGLTGQSGAGKSSVARVLAQSGFAVIDADKIVRNLYQPCSPCLTAVASAFGSDIIKPDGTPNRPLLAQRVFSSKENTALLGQLVHPFVMYELLKQIRAEQQNGTNTVIYDAPQLFESNSDLICDTIISVVASENIRLKRICERDNLTEQKALERMNAQLSEEFFRENSDYIIENNSDINSLKEQTQIIINKLRRGE